MHTEQQSITRPEVRDVIDVHRGRSALLNDRRNPGYGSVHLSDIPCGYAFAAVDAHEYDVPPAARIRHVHESAAGEPRRGWAIDRDLGPANSRREHGGI